MNAGRFIPKPIAPCDYTEVKALDVDSNKVVHFLCAPCPNCDKWIVANPAHRFCEWCGQALEWVADKKK